MNKNIKIILINLPIAMLLFCCGYLFFEITRHISSHDLSKFVYALLTILFFISSIVLIFFISRISYYFTLIVCFVYLIFFIFVTIYTLKTDKTGQGLIGLFFLVPQAIISFLTIGFLMLRIKNFKNHITRQSS